MNQCYSSLIIYYRFYLKHEILGAPPWYTKEEVSESMMILKHIDPLMPDQSTG